MKIADALIAVLFFVFAAVQYNDPDTALWMAFYAAVGVIAALAFFGKYSPPLVFVVLGACLAGLAASAPGFVEFLTGPERHALMERMSDSRPFIEETREFLGLSLAMAALVFYAFRVQRAPRRGEAPPA